MATIMEIINTAKPGDKVTLVTHAGKFHADDAMSTAILTLFFDSIGVSTNIVRTFKPAEEGYTDDTPMCIVYDIGLGRYDHHQVGDDAKHCERIDIRKAENGEIDVPVLRKYAAVGLIWRELGPQWLGEKYSDIVYNTIIRYIDDADNGFGFNPLSSIVSYNNPTSSSFDNFDAEFNKVVSTLHILFSGAVKHFAYMAECEEKLREAATSSQGICLVTDEYLPGADEVCRECNFSFYVYPNLRQPGSYCFKTVPVAPESDEKIMDIPDEVRNWDGVTFLHPSCFLGSAVSKERAIEVCTLIALMKNL